MRAAFLTRNDKLGLAYYTAVCHHARHSGRTFHQIYDSLESVGAGLGFSASTLTGAFSGRSLAEDLPLCSGHPIRMSAATRFPATSRWSACVRSC